MFTYYSPCILTSGENAFRQTGKICAKYSNKLLVLTYNGFVKNEGLSSLLSDMLKAENIEYKIIRVSGEPTVQTVSNAIDEGRIFSCGALLAIGGGSVIDTAKAAAGLIPNGGEVTEYLEGVGTGRKFLSAPLPLIAVPTTAGTGAEATKNAVISGEGFKKSLRDERLFAREIIIDPLLHLSTPASVTAHSGMDALTQAIECATSIKRTPLSDMWAFRSLEYCRSLRAAYDNGSDTLAREKMAMAAYMSGVALSCGGLGAAHGIAASLGVNLGISHGLACAILLPHVIELNRCCEKIYSNIAKTLFDANGTQEENYSSLIEYIKELNRHFGIPENLKGYNLKMEQIKKIAFDSFGSSMGGNPKPLSLEDVENLICKLI